MKNRAVMTILLLAVGINLLAPPYMANAVNPLNGGLVTGGLVDKHQAQVEKVKQQGKPRILSENLGSVGKTKVLSLQEAIKYAQEHNPDLAIVAMDLKFRELDQDKADYFSDQQRDADRQVRDGWDELKKQREQFEAIKNTLDQATRDMMESQLVTAETELNAASKYSIDTLQEAQIAELIEEKARVGLSVTQLGQQVAAQKVALAVEKCYYDALKAQHLARVKEKSYQRALTQHNLAKASFETGMRAKDDMLLAHIQADLMKADWEKAKSDCTVALVELRKVMGMEDLQSAIQLQDDFTTSDVKVGLQDGIKQALGKRLEITKAQAELDVYRLNWELANRYTAPNTFDTREAELNVKKAEKELVRQRLMVEAEVRQSYSTMMALQNMLKYIEQSRPEALTSVDLATSRYREGYIFANATLKIMHAEDAAGTIIEVLAAQEKLAEVEEKTESIIYGYNLARGKYLFDIGQGL